MSCINVIFPLFFLPSEKPCGNSASCIDFCLSGWLLRHQNVLLHLTCGSWDSCLKVNCLSPLPLKSCRYSNSHTQPRHNPLFLFLFLHNFAGTKHVCPQTPAATPATMVAPLPLKCWRDQVCADMTDKVRQKGESLSRVTPSSTTTQSHLMSHNKINNTGTLSPRLTC